MFASERNLKFLTLFERSKTRIGRISIRATPRFLFRK
jgi:hypothetical protein